MNTKQFKNLLKESIRSDGSNILNQVSEVDYTDADTVLGGHYEDDLKKATKKFKNKNTNRAITGWQKSSPETLERYLNSLQRIGNAYSNLANRRKSTDDKQWLEDFIKLFNLDLESEDGEKILGYDRKFDEQFLNFIDKSFGDKQNPLSFANFRKNMVNWNKMRAKDEGDFWKIEDSGGNILLRESLDNLLKENLENDVQNILTYHGNIFLDAFNDHRQQLAKEKGHESAEDEEEFSKKNIADLADKLDDAKKEIEEASAELTSDNLMTLVRYSVFGKFLEKPETMKKIHGTFGNYIKTAVESYLNNEGANIELFRDGVLEILKNSPLYSSKSPKIVSDLLKGKKVDSLRAVWHLIDKKPHGFQGSQNTKTFSDIIAKAKKSEQDLNESVYGGEIKEYLNSFLPFAKKRLNYDKEPKINFVSDPENGKIPLGKTAYYEPANMAVTVFTDNRHPKDIMRSLSHELVHHSQNCDGQFDSNKGVGEGYAQNDEHLRKMEEDAYLRGNMCFRDWEDEYKQTNRAFGNQLKENRERLYYELMRRFK